MTKTVKDNAFLLNIVAGQDSNDDTTIDNKNPDYLNENEKGYRRKKKLE